MTAKCLSRAERIDWLRLINSENVGPATFHALLSRYHTVARAIERLPELSARGGHRGTLRICARERAEAYLQRAEEFGARMLA
ncbi:putative Rossmann fold nucleotide-binding protein DprA/Smf involved in DNA uptake [Rhodoligotrophos appendicifer]|uniref:hypothetical protein n=1 Tax=Rhodoligotrophos appendicifer TaxID=987056 RepID=UPI00319E369A